ncbi:MAG TPA: hypothetical protein VE076_05425 [Nitrososphaeraceae archaeon]|jgi:hypothetical protein|nr:hypothetical protein [Nitrososphaeraceae archaeon]
MKTAIFFVLALSLLDAVGVTTTVMSSVTTAYAKAPPSQSNPNPVEGGRLW